MTVNTVKLGGLFICFLLGCTGIIQSSLVYNNPSDLSYSTTGDLYEPGTTLTSTCPDFSSEFLWHNGDFLTESQVTTCQSDGQWTTDFTEDECVPGKKKYM